MSVEAPADPIEELRKQHRSLLKKLEGIRQAAASFEKSTSPEPLRKLILDSVASFTSGLDIHVHNEESVVFPAYEAVVGQENKHLGETRTAHPDLSADMKATLVKIETIARDLTLRKATEAAHSIEELNENVDFLLKRWSYHTQLEEKYLFPDMQQKLDASTLKNLARQMRQTSGGG